MSADNYYLVRKHPDGGYAAVMGFASDDDTPVVTSRHRSYPTPEEAFWAASDNDPEYGVRWHEEVRR